MRGNLILIFSFIFCADKFSAAQNCSQPPPNFNASRVRECCKVPPIESVMYKFVDQHCKDLVKTLQIAIHSKPVGNLTTSNGQGSQNTQQVQQSTQSASQNPPTTLLSNPITTTIAAITTILPITTQSEQQATSQVPQQSEPQSRPPQQSSNPGQQQGSPQQHASGQGNTQNHVPHKKPPPPKMPARYTIPFMCAMECTMNQLEIVTNGKYNKENADNFLQNVLKDDDFTPVLQKVMPDCVEIASEKANKFVTTYNYTGCNTFGGHYLRCINQEAANYCPNSKLSQTSTCNNLQNYIKTCGPPKY